MSRTQRLCKLILRRAAFQHLRYQRILARPVDTTLLHQ